MSRHLPIRYATLAVLLLALGFGGCVHQMQPMAVKRAHPGLQSAVHPELGQLPPPPEKIVAAVYRFRDQTGQYKPSEVGASWSTAVTQGATSILVRALEESGWFIPIEREGLSNLLNERQIIQATRAQHTGPDGEPLGPLPPLLYAGVMLEGGIVGYDTNVLTGGVGVRYLGVGGSGQYRQDQVTIYLRAVSTQNGRVLKTVHTTKTIVSQKVDGGAFRFLDVERLLETEVGYSFNEPPVLAVTEAIEAAVRSLVIEGLRDGLWTSSAPNEEVRELLASQDAVVARAGRLNYFGQAVRSQRRGLGIGLTAGLSLFESDYYNPLARPALGLTFTKTLTPAFSLGLGGSVSQLAVQDEFTRNHLAADLQGVYHVLPHSRLTPFLIAGGGALLQDIDESFTDRLFPYLMGGGGFEYMATPHLGLRVSLTNQYALREGLDGVDLGRVHDNFWLLSTGLVLY